MREDITQRARELASAATPGPWIEERRTFRDGSTALEGIGPMAAMWCNDGTADLYIPDHDLAYLLGVGPDVVLQLVAEVERLRSEMDQAVEDWGANDETVMADSHRLADENERLRTARTITTPEQLNALPHGALIVYEYISQAGFRLNEVWERRNDVWCCLAAPIARPSIGTPSLPALLVWQPEVQS